MPVKEPAHRQQLLCCYFFLPFHLLLLLLSVTALPAFVLSVTTCQEAKRAGVNPLSFVSGI